MSEIEEEKGEEKREKEIDKNNQKEIKEKESNNKGRKKEEQEGEKEEQEEQEEQEEREGEKGKDGQEEDQNEDQENELLYDKTVKNIELRDNIIYCYIGKEDNKKLSKEVIEEIKNIPYKNMKFEGDMRIKYYYGKDQYIYYHIPLVEKKIKIYNSKGLEFKAIIYFIEDIKNIVKYLKMKEPYYFDESTNQYKKLLTDDDYEMFLLKKENEIVKDISYSSINFIKLEKLYKKKEKKEKNERGKIVEYLSEINDNLQYYSKVKKLKNEKVFYTLNRNVLFKSLTIFYKKNKKILGIYGNYSSGKSISLMMYNYYSEYPSLYLNLKALKNSFHTKGYTTILPNEAMNIYIKSKKTFEDHKKFIEKIYEITYDSFEQFIISIINNFIDWNGFIFLDQYSHELFDSEFINHLQKIINTEGSTIKILLICSMNDKWIREIYVDSITDYLNRITKTEDLEFIFLNKLISKDDLANEQIDINLISYLELFDYLPMYYSLIMKNKSNIDEYISEIKKEIEKKMKKFFKDSNQEDNIIQMNDIRLKIDEEIDSRFFANYNNIIPFKYFYIEKQYEKTRPKAYLKCHFPLIKEVWNEIIYSKTLDLFDGEINYTGSVIGSLLELNFIRQCQDKNNSFLEVDCVVELDNLYSMNKITKSSPQDYKNKNILLIQKNENAPSFDVGFLKSKNTEEPSMAYIQIKKSSSDNKVDKSKTFNIFEKNKPKFENFFNIKPKSCYLIYITLINKFVKNNIDSFEKIKNKQKKNNMDSKTIDYIKRINELDKFCRNDNISLYYFNPKEKKFYIRKGISFFGSELNLFVNESKVTKEISMKITLLSRKKEREFCDNESKAEEFNAEFKNKKIFDNNISLNGSKNFQELVYHFIKNYCENAKVKTFLYLEKELENFIFYSSQENMILLGIVKNSDKNMYSIKSVIYDNYIFDYSKLQNYKFIDTFELDVKEYDLLVWIQFEKFNLNGKNVFKNK